MTRTEPPIRTHLVSAGPDLGSDRLRFRSDLSGRCTRIVPPGRLAAGECSVAVLVRAPAQEAAKTRFARRLLQVGRLCPGRPDMLVERG